MDFETWLKKHPKPYKDKSIKNYVRTVSGPLSDWAGESGIFDNNLTSIRDIHTWDAIIGQIERLPTFLQRNGTGHRMYGRSAALYREYLSNQQSEPSDHVEESQDREYGSDETLVRDLASLENDPTIRATEKNELRKARLGQGKFRLEVLRYWAGRCAVTRCDVGTILVASHILPWSESSNPERLDPFNGLFLTPNLDKAFDRGLISFSDNGAILISPRLTSPGMLGINEMMALWKISPKHQHYLKKHREKYAFESSKQDRG